MRPAAAFMLVVTLSWWAVPSAAQQVKPRTDTTRDADRSGVGTRTVTGTVKTTTDNGLVVVGRKAGQKDKEWPFALDSGTRIDGGGKMKAANELREGDAVAVTYTHRDGKIVAQSIKVKAR